MKFESNKHELVKRKKLSAIVKELRMVSTENGENYYFLEFTSENPNLSSLSLSQKAFDNLADDSKEIVKTRHAFIELEVSVYNHDSDKKQGYMHKGEFVECNKPKGNLALISVSELAPFLQDALKANIIAQRQTDSYTSF